MTFVPVVPKGSHFGEMSQASARMMVLHPSHLSLLPPFHPSSTFFILKGHHLQIQVWGDKSNYIFSSGFTLRKPPNHLWLKHRDYSRGKMSLVAALPASLSWFHPPLFSHANCDDDSEADCSAALGGLRPFSQQRSSVSLNVTQGASGRLTWICSWASLTPEPRL